MDKEIACINNILLKSSEPITTSEISKKIFEEYKMKLSKKIVSNYLWSYFRSLIKYNPTDYTYVLKNDTFLIDDIITEEVQNKPRAITTKINGSQIQLEYDINVKRETLIKALGIINYKTNFLSKNIDFIKHLNRTIEQINHIDNE